MMGGAEVINLASDVVQCGNKIACKNHWDDLVRSIKIKQFKIGKR